MLPVSDKALEVPQDEVSGAMLRHDPQKQQQREQQALERSQPLERPRGQIDPFGPQDCPLQNAKFMIQISKLTIANNKLKVALKRERNRLKAHLNKERSEESYYKAKWDNSPDIMRAVFRHEAQWVEAWLGRRVRFINRKEQYVDKKDKLINTGGDLMTLGPEPTMKKPISVRIGWVFPNLRKSVPLVYSITDYNQPLLYFLYFHAESRVKPIFGGFLMGDCESGAIPKLTDDLKLFFSSTHVDNGRWVQFHGPGMEVDGGNRYFPLSALSLIDRKRSGKFLTADDSDRCDLSIADCAILHPRNGSTAYEKFHSAKQEGEKWVTDFQISIRWEVGFVPDSPR